MMKRLEKNQLKALDLLINKYESNTNYFKNEEKIRTVRIKPSDVYLEYGSRFVNIEEEDRFVDDMNELVEEQYVSLSYNDKSKIIEKIALNIDKLNEVYSVIGRDKKKKLINDYIEKYEEIKKEYITNPVIVFICDEKLAKLRKGNLPGSAQHKEYYDRSVQIIQLINGIMTNTQTLYIREFSQMYLNDTKIFSLSYKNAVCKYIYNVMGWESILKGLNKEDKDEKALIEYIVLANYNIYPNPVYIYLSGDFQISFNDGSLIKVRNGNSIAIPADKIEDIAAINIEDNNIITIENKTSFSRFNKTDYMCIFIEGYNSTAVSKFIKKIKTLTDNKNWYHFGDIDPDGFFILEHLKQTTGINFKPKYMDINTLSEYKDYGKKLENNDKVKANNLINDGQYTDIVKYMIDNNIKLEQEIISTKI